MAERSDAPADVDLTREERADIDGMFLRLATTSYYELLDVPRDADRRVIRDAYFALSQRFHPDAWFGRHLGLWQPRVDAIFRDVTVAYEVLSHRERRAEYDVDLRRQRGTERPPASVAPVRLRPSERPANAHSEPPARIPVVPVMHTPEEHRAAAREALARKLGRRHTPLGTPVTRGPATPAGSSSPLESLRAMMEQRGEAERRQRVETLRRTAEDAAKKGDLSGASNALSLASQFAPEDVDLKRRSGELDGQMVEARTLKSIGEAEECERSGHWEKAAAAWERAASTRPDDHTLFDKAALALLRAGTDLPRAAELARRATVVAPRSVETYAILAQVFMAGGLRASALSALDTASKLDPTSVLVKDLIVKIKG